MRVGEHRWNLHHLGFEVSYYLLLVGSVAWYLFQRNEDFALNLLQTLAISYTIESYNDYIGLRHGNFSLKCFE